MGFLTKKDIPKETPVQDVPTATARSALLLDDSPEAIAVIRFYNQCAGKPLDFILNEIHKLSPQQVKFLSRYAIKTRKRNEGDQKTSVAVLMAYKKTVLDPLKKSDDSLWQIETVTLVVNFLGKKIFKNENADYKGQIRELYTALGLEP